MKRCRRFRLLKQGRKDFCGEDSSAYAAQAPTLTAGKGYTADSQRPGDKDGPFFIVSTFGDDKVTKRYNTSNLFSTFQARYTQFHLYLYLISYPGVTKRVYIH